METSSNLPNIPGFHFFPVTIPLPKIEMLPDKACGIYILVKASEDQDKPARIVWVDCTTSALREAIETMARDRRFSLNWPDHAGTKVCGIADDLPTPEYVAMHTEASKLRRDLMPQG